MSLMLMTLERKKAAKRGNERLIFTREPPTDKIADRGGARIIRRA